MSRSMKIWKKGMERRLKAKVKICERQYGLMPRKTTTDALFSLGMLMKKMPSAKVKRLRLAGRSK